MARRQMMALLESALQSTTLPSTLGIADMGSGWGTLVVALARRYPQRLIVGYELSWLPWLVSCGLKHLLGLSNVTLLRCDFAQADLQRIGAVVCYLCPQAMRHLHHTLMHRPHQVRCIISHTFALPQCVAAAQRSIPDLYHSPIYRYDWPQAS